MKPYVPKYLHFTVTESKRPTGVCIARCCRNRQGKDKGGLCYAHYHRRRRIIDPIGERYWQWKADAKRRGKEHTVTLDEFRAWCVRTGYMMKRGYCGRNATIDRVDNRRGYHIWNIQLKPNIENIRKYHGVDKHLTELPRDHEDWVPF